MTLLHLGQILIGILLGSALTIQLFVIPGLMARIPDRSTITRVSNGILRKHHTLSLLLLIPAAVFFCFSHKTPALALSGILVALNLYQRFWIFTKLHLIKQPMGVQDLIQPDNVLRAESNRLQRMVYLLFRIHMVLLLIDLVICAF